MKLTRQILRSHCHGPLREAEFLNLSNLGLVSVDKFNYCPKLQTLLLQGNKLEDASGLECCKQLWHLDISNNRLQSLEGLSQFLALGTLVLSNNNLVWSSLTCIRQVHILNISLHGNPQLEKDPYYRIHVIDCLPNVWMLDGRIITSAERIQTRQFFQDSALSERPVRRKMKKDGFIPTALKTLELNGIFGNKAVQLMRTFPQNPVLNIEIDKKRLHYLAQDIQEDLIILRRNTYRKQFAASRGQKQTFLLDALEARQNNKEKANMLLILLAASLEFVLPTYLVKETLEKNNLYRSSSFQAMDLFLLPKGFRCRVLSILFNALKVDRDENKDGGVHPHLYLCLLYITQEMTRVNETLNYPHIKHTADISRQLQDYKCLLAFEVVKMMCIVPALFDLLPYNADLVRLATDEPGFVEHLVEIFKLPSQSSECVTMPEKVREDITKHLLSKVHERIEKLTSKTPWVTACDRILCKSGALPMKRQNTVVCKADYLYRGTYIPDYRPPSIKPRKMSAKDRSKAPELGDIVLLGPQTLGKIISLPQSNVALVLMDAVPVASGAVELRLSKPDNHYDFINTDHLEWDYQFSVWKPKGTVCDKFTMKSIIESLEAGQDAMLRGSNGFPVTSEAATPWEQDQPYPLRPLVNTSLCEHLRPTTSECSETTFPTKPRRRIQSAFVIPPQDLPVSVSKGSPFLSLTMLHRTEQNEVFLTTKNVCMQDGRFVDHVHSHDRSIQLKATDHHHHHHDQKNLDLDLALFGDDVETDRRGTARLKNQSEDKELQRNEEDKAKENKPTTDEGISLEHIVKATAQEEKAEDSRASTREDNPQSTLSYQQEGGGQGVSPITKMESQTLETTSLRSGSERHLDFYTEFEQQRIDEWKKTAIPSSEQNGTHSVQLPPPQPPSSPDIKDSDKRPAREGASYVDGIHFLRNVQMLRPLSVPDASRWLGGGRDLYWENLRRRPKSSHTPGWKIGLPEGMQRRPKSAAARSMRYLKAGGVHIQTFQNRIDADEFADLSDFPWLSMAHGGVGTRGSQQSLFDEDPLPGPVHDSVASPMVVWSYHQPLSTDACLPKVGERHWSDGKDFNFKCNPSCTTPESDF